MCPSFPFGIKGGIWDVIVLIPDHCLSIYFGKTWIRKTYFVRCCLIHFNLSIPLSDIVCKAYILYSFRPFIVWLVVCLFVC